MRSISTQLFPKNKLRPIKWMGLLFLLPLIMTACRKEKIDLPWGRQATPTALRLHDVQFLSPDTGFAWGGDRYFKGILLKTYDGGQTWLGEDSIINKALFGGHFASTAFGVAVGFDAKLMRTHNGGFDWQLHQGHTWHPLFDVFLVNDQLGFACGGRGYVNGAIYRTVNGGFNWTVDTFDMALESLYFTNENTGFAGGYGFVLKTTDGGVSWNPTSAQGDFFTSLHFPTAETGYAAGYQGLILKTTDGGDSWEKVHHPNRPFGRRLHFHCIYFTSPVQGYAAGRDGLFLKTSDGGTSWQEVENVPNVHYFGLYVLPSGEGFLVGDGGVILKFQD